ncbi:mechanosensitive ion channel family protein [Solicola gregarius]|uniref:Mechanosensitive ion channel family protein n=1 Tax=Solicola gregarius TaxID=2908642 RepID=A0AA46TGT6_9ACTN|nr:mechanosensitive ion channel family protein [Solicola gregarius]UYM04268.1 mechanosensitive ion channel family protein [Solicola gregarius]
MDGVLAADDAANCWTGDDATTVCRVVHGWTNNDTAAEVANWLLAKPLSIATLIIVSLLVRWVLHRLIERFTERAAQGKSTSLFQRVKNGGAPAAAKVSERREQRTRTLGSVLKSMVTGIVFAVMTVMIISELGYNIAPLIASAGVLGLAVAFGAQNLVADFVSGTFMMFEDQYGVGDEVDLGDAVGTVEAVSLRVTRVRDINGTVWYVRNGQINRVGNSSQNWARTVLDVRVSYTEDLTQVREVLHDVAKALWQDPEWGGYVLEEPEVWGVERWDPDAIVLRVVLKTAPLKQWGVAREMRELVKDRFDALGIEIPLPQRVLHIQDDRRPSDLADEPEDPSPER